jgi:hypothetical protein
MSDRRNLLYILAPSFSGSTLLTYLLAQHSEIATVGELKATQMGPIEKYHCSCDASILGCEFWKSVQTKADAAGLEFSLDKFGTVFEGAGALSDRVVCAGVRGTLFELVRSVVLRTMPGVSSRLDTLALRNRNLADIVCQLQGGRIFLDGSKDATRLLHLINSGYWNVKVIYLQRDGRGVSSSIKLHVGIRYLEAVREWEHSVCELQRMRKRLDSPRTFDLKYEDLCSKPAECMHRIWDWLNIKPLEIQETHFKNGEFHILGNAMRLNQMSEIRLDEKWKQSLSDKDLRIFETRVGALNRQLGYV